MTIHKVPEGNCKVMSFSDVVEAIKSLSHEEKQEIQILLAQYLREERREEIYNNYQSSRLEEQNDQLVFFSNTSELKQLLEEGNGELALVHRFGVPLRNESKARQI